MDFLQLSGKKHAQIDLTKVVFSNYVIKINYKGKCQKRALIITNTTIYNCKPNGLRVKRTIPISNIENFTLSSSSNNFILATKTGYDYNLNYKDPKALVDVISKQIHPKELSIYFVDKTNLLEYTRTATKHKQINKRRKDINKTLNTNKLTTNGVVYKMPSSSQVKSIFKEKEALLIYYGLIDNKDSKELNSIEMWNIILKLKEQQNLNNFDNFLQFILNNNNNLNGAQKNEFIATLKNVLLTNHVIKSTDNITKHLNTLTTTNNNNNSNNNNNYGKENNKLKIPTGLNTNKDNNKASASVNIKDKRPTIKIQGLKGFKLSFKSPNNNINTSNSDRPVIDLSSRPNIDLTLKVSPLKDKQSTTKPSHNKITNTSSNSNNNSNVVKKKKFRKLHLKEIADVALQDSIFLTTSKPEIDKLSKLLISDHLEPLFLVGFKLPSDKKDKKPKKDKKVKKDKDNTVKENIKSINKVKVSKFSSSPSILDAKVEQDLNIMFHMFRMLPYEILINLLTYNKQFCSLENIEKLYISITSLSNEYKDMFIKKAENIKIENKVDNIKETNTELINKELSKTENYLLLLFTQKDIVFKLRLLLEAQNFNENSIQLNERLNTFISLSDKLSGCLNVDKVILSFNILYNKLNDKQSNGYLIDELKDKLDFGTNNHNVKILDYILSELSDNKLITKELKLDSTKNSNSNVINVMELKEELNAAKDLMTTDISGALETLKEFNILDEQRIEKNNCEMFKNSLMTFMNENKGKLKELKEKEDKIKGFIKEFVVKYKGGRNYNERTGKNDFEVIIEMMKGMITYVEKYVKKVNSI